MATMNPLEKKARSSFIKGLVIAGLIGIIIIALLVMQIINLRQEEEAREATLKTIYVLNEDVESGRIITQDMLSLKIVESSMIPADAIQSVGTYYLRDQNGNPIYSIEEDGERFLAVEIDGQQYEIVLDSGITIDDVDDGSTGSIEIDGGISAIVINGSPLIAKVDLSANTVITTGMVAESSELTADSTRIQEYNMISLPAEVETGDTIDIRLRMPDGTDYIVVSKKSITILDIDGVPSTTTFTLQLTEEEIQIMSNAIVEAYQMEGSKLYVTKYVEAGLQAAATITYTPSTEVLDAISENPNILNEAKSALQDSISSTVRNNINAELSKYDEDERDEAVSSGTSSEITTQEEERQTYLDSLQ